MQSSPYVKRELGLASYASTVDSNRPADVNNAAPETSNGDSTVVAPAAVATAAVAAAAAAANEARLLDAASAYSAVGPYPQLYAFPPGGPPAVANEMPPYCWPPANGLSPGAYPAMPNALGMPK